MKKAMAKAKRQQEFEIGEIKRRSEIELEELRWKCDQALVVENGRKKHAELEHEQKLVKASEQLQNATIETQPEDPGEVDGGAGLVGSNEDRNGEDQGGDAVQSQGGRGSYKSSGRYRL